LTTGVGPLSVGDGDGVCVTSTVAVALGAGVAVESGACPGNEQATAATMSVASERKAILALALAINSGNLETFVLFAFIVCVSTTSRCIQGPAAILRVEHVLQIPDQRRSQLPQPLPRHSRTDSPCAPIRA